MIRKHGDTVRHEIVTDLTPDEEHAIRESRRIASLYKDLTPEELIEIEKQLDKTD